MLPAHKKMEDTSQLTIMFLCETETELQELIALAEKCHEQGEYNITIAVPSAVAKSKWFDKTSVPLRKIVIRAFSSKHKDPRADKVKKKGFHPRQWIRGKWMDIREKLPADVKERLMLATILKSTLQKAHTTLKNEAISTLVVTDDRTLYTLPWIAAARSRGIKVSMVSFAISHPEGGSFMRRDRVDHYLHKGDQQAFKKKFARKHPTHVYASKYGEMFFYKTNVARTLKKLNMLPPCPWVSGGGLSDQVFVMSPEDKALMESLGVRKPIKVVGQCVLDKLWESNANSRALKQRICESYALPIHKPILIFAVPHLAEHQIYSWEEHERRLRPLLQMLAEQTHVSALLSLHPRAKKKFYEALGKEYGIAVAAEPLCNILPAAAIYMATHSSTARWAALLRIPGIILDYGIGHTFLRNLQGNVLLSESDTAGILAHIETLTHDADVYAKAQKMLGNSLSGTLFDGQVRMRILRGIGVCQNELQKAG